MRLSRLQLGLAFLAAAALLWLFEAPSAVSGTAAVYTSPDVTPGPQPVEATKSFSLADPRGVYERRVFGSGPNAAYVNVLFTEAGFLRSGDVHKCEQLNHVVFGELILTQRDVRRKRDVTSRHSGGAVIRIRPHVPHLYTFLADTLMTEAWRLPNGQPCPFQAWHYAPYRERIPAASAIAAHFDVAGESDPEVAKLQAQLEAGG